MTEEEFALEKYGNHRRGAKERGIEWLFTFEEWWGVWQRSGRWHQRGRCAGQYVMARFGDVGPYSVDNVFICTHAQNIRDAHLGHLTHLGKGRGWTYCSKGARRYQVMVSNKYVGVFHTQAEAERAYAAAVEKFRVEHCNSAIHSTASRDRRGSAA